MAIRATHLPLYIAIVALLLSGCSKHEDIVPPFKASNISWTHNEATFGGDVNALLSAGATLYAGTSRGVYTSTDNGGTWVKTNFNVLVLSMGAIGNNVVAGTDQGIFFSEDAGKTWTKSTYSVSSSINYVTGFAAAGNTLFALNGFAGAYISSDNGKSWSVATNSGLPGAATLECYVAVGSTVYGGGSMGVYATTNNASSWTPVNNGLSGRYIHALAATNGILFAGTDNGIYTSSNNGASWTYSYAVPFNVTCLAVSGNSVYAGQEESDIAVSTDLGAHWQIAGVGIKFPITSILVKGTTFLVSTAYDGISTSLDGGATFFLATNGINNPYLSFVQAVGDKIFIGGDIGILNSRDGGLSWSGGKYQSGSISVGSYALIAKGNTLFAATAIGLYASIDNGNTWLPKYSSVSYPTGLALLGNTIVAINQSGIYRSTDDGNTWVQSMTGFPISEEVVSLASIGGKFYVGTYSKGIYVSSDGSQWTALSGNLSLQNFIIYDFASANNLIYIATDRGVYLSSDNGSTWASLNTFYATCITIDGDNVLTGVSGQGVYLSTDKGKTWSAVSQGLSNYDLYVHDVSVIGNKIYLATSNGLFTSPY